jgi:two-component system, NtrC family, nitrogen regulation sensor histidine kinase NtrY
LDWLELCLDTFADVLRPSLLKILSLIFPLQNPIRFPDMIKRALLYVVVMLILLALAFSVGQWDKDTALLQEQADELSAYLSRQATDGLSWAKAHSAGRATAAELDAQASADYTVLLHRGDSILFWSNTRVSLPAQVLKSLGEKPGRRLLRLPAGWFLANAEPAGENVLTTLVPIRYELNINDLENKNPFPGGTTISPNIGVSAVKTDYPVAINGQALCWLTPQGPVQSAWLQWVKLLAYTLFFGVFFALLNQVAKALSARFGAFAGAALLLAVVGGLLALNVSAGFTARQFGALPLFAPTFENASLVGASVGDWLVHVALLVFVMVFFHRQFRNDPSPTGRGVAGANASAERSAASPLPVGESLSRFIGRLGLGLAAVCYLLAMLSIPFGVEVARQLVFHSRIGFDFDNLLNLGPLGFLSLLGIIALMLGLFLFSHRMMTTVQSLDLPRAKRVVAMFGAGLVVVGLSIPLGMNPLFVGLFALLYAAVFDAFVHWESTGFGWIVCWLLLFSLFASTLLYRYNTLKDKQLRIAYAEALADDRDTATAEKLLPRIFEEIKKDSQQIGQLLKPWPFKADPAQLQTRLNELVFRENYLFQHYRLRVFAFDRENQPIVMEQALGHEQVLREQWEKAQPLPGTPEIRFRTDDAGKFRYLLRFGALRVGDAAQPATIFVFLDHDYPAPTRVYAQLFYNIPYKDLDRLARYDFAVLKNQQLVVEQGQSNAVFAATDLANGSVRESVSPDSRRVDAVAKSIDGQTVASVGRLSGGWLKQVYLFSVLFALASLFLLALALANSWLGFLPAEYDFRLSAKGSLARRIHFWNVSLIAVSFFVVGFLTYRHFTQSARDAERTDLDFRAEALHNNLKAQLLGFPLSADSLQRTLPQSLRVLSASLGMDANLFGPAGDLAFSTQPDLAQLGILPNKMNARAWSFLKENRAPERVEMEQLAGFQYFTKYLPLRDGQNQLLGFLGVPYQLSQQKAGAEVSDFIGILASLYVFLLLIAYAVTFLLARSITRPVSLLSEKVRALKLEDKNEPLAYAGDAQDEISDLIGQYNRMVDKLEASKVQLVRLEREGAWREMARQVAHDIKNPLTTMKLSMQQLERVSSNPEQAAAYLRKAITRLIEQIDSLAQIASEFSMFANLDIKHKNDVVINEVVESVHDLFSEQRHVALELTLPPERFHILGDKNHLIRVFNNLVINAIQAIPSDRQGHIKVSLAREGRLSVVKISDNGGGIPPEIRDRVFEPNFTTKTSGSGLGLAICKKIIEAHDGDIRFETRDDEGTDFFVEIPVTAVG